MSLEFSTHLEFFTTNDLPSSLGPEIAAFLDSQNTSHPFQFPQWAGPATGFVLLRQAGRICWFASCGKHFPLGSRFPSFRAWTLNRGPVCDDLQLWQAGLDGLVQHARKAGCVYLEAAPDRLHEHPSGPVLEFSRDWKPEGGGRASLRLDLTKTEEDLLAGLRKTTRYEVRRAERAELVVEPSAELADIEEFLQLYVRTADRKGFSADSSEHLRGVARWLIVKPTRGALLLARGRASDVASGGVATNVAPVAGGAIIVRSGKRCWYVWGATDKHDQFSAGHALQWRAIRWAKAQGCTEYDFGGYTPGATSGPAWFKEGFGGELVHFVPAHRRVIKGGLYRLFEVLSKLR